MGKGKSADDVMLRKSPDAELSVLDKMILWSRNKPLTKEELAAFGPAEKKADQGLTVRPFVTIKSFGEGRNRRIVPFIGIKGAF